MSPRRQGWRVLSAVGFDLDYTLAVPERDRATILAETVERVGAPEITREEYLAAHRDHLAAETRAPVFEALLPDDAGVAPEDLAAAYRAGVEAALVPVPGAVDLVESLRDRYRVALLTDGPVRAQQGKLERLGWTDLFDAVVITGSLPAPKPDWRAFDHLLDAMETPPWTTAYVGDHPEVDVRGANDAGLRPVHVVYDGGPDPAPEADAVVQRDALATDLPDALETL